MKIYHVYNEYCGDYTEYFNDKYFKDFAKAQNYANTLATNFLNNEFTLNEEFGETTPYFENDDTEKHYILHGEDEYLENVFIDECEVV